MISSIQRCFSIDCVQQWQAHASVRHFRRRLRASAAPLGLHESSDVLRKKWQFFFSWWALLGQCSALAHLYLNFVKTQF
jgi:hypothetical protein